MLYEVITRELEALRRVHRHERHALVPPVVEVDVGDERHLVEEELDLAAVLVGDARVRASYNFV